MVAVLVPVAVLVVQQHLDRLDELLADGVQQRVLRVHVVAYQQADHFQILVVDGHQQRRPAQRIDAIYVYWIFVI